MEDKKQTKPIFAIEGMRPADPKALQAFKESMEKEIIPRVLQRVEDRRLAAAETKHLRLNRLYGFRSRS